MQIHTCIIVEDDAIDSIMLQAMVKRQPTLRLAGAFDNAADALRFIENYPVDVLFSDVEMKDMDGLELRKRAMSLPACIFVTSYPEYAADSFPLDVLDYIVKPLTAERFSASIQRLDDYLELRRKAGLFDYSLGGQCIFIKEGTKQIKVALHEVRYLEALRDYTRVVTPDKAYCVLGSLHGMLEQQAFQRFVRVHRSYAVQQHFVAQIEAGHVHLDGGITLPVGRSYRDGLDRLRTAPG